MNQRLREVLQTPAGVELHFENSELTERAQALVGADGLHKPSASLGMRGTSASGQRSLGLPRPVADEGYPLGLAQTANGHLAGFRFACGALPGTRRRMAQSGGVG
jgi:2-polyprenyl-6-methoxyphenol hydroxylase-like FAD-dependent oxidoreductase